MIHLEPKELDKVTRLWTTNSALGAVDVTAFLSDEGKSAVDSSGPAFEVAPIEQWVTDPSAIANLFIDVMGQVAAADRVHGVSVPAITDVDMELQIWRAGYEMPMYSTSGPYLGWLFLHGTESEHADSGVVAVLDPRAGSSMSAVPGLPWGRSLTVSPTRGSLGVVPGWLTSTVLPLEQQQFSVVVVATAVTDAVA